MNQEPAQYDGAHQQHDPPSGKPSQGFAPVGVKHHAEKKGKCQGGAGHVETLVRLFFSRRNDPHAPEKGDDADGHVDEKDEPPAQVVGNDTAQHRPEHQAQGNGGGIDADGFAALPWFKYRGDNGQAQRHLHGHGDALDSPENDEHPDVPGQPAQQGCTGKAGQAGEKDAFVAEDVPKPAVNQDERTDGQEVDGRNPLHKGVVGLEITGDGGKNHIDNAPIDGAHDDAQHHGAEDHPFVFAALWAGRVREHLAFLSLSDALRSFCHVIYAARISLSISAGLCPK